MMKRFMAFLTAAGMLATMTGCGAASKEQPCEFGNVAIGGGGYIPGIVYSKAEEGLRYCRTDIGGAYRQSRRDEQWVPITDHFGGVNGEDWNLIGIESIAADPVDPKRVYLACGTYASGGSAILSSEDYGETWTKADMTCAMGGNLSGRGVGERLAVNPKNNSQVFFGSRAAGLWVSNDYGKTWEENKALPVKGDYIQEKNQIGIMWIEFAGDGGMFVGVAMKDGNCVYYSPDGGASFEQLPISRQGMYPLRAAVSENGYLYLCFSDSCGPNAQVKDGAVVRYHIATRKSEEITPQCNDGRYGGFSGISVDGSDPNVIVCGTLGYWSEKGENLYRSTDGGESWTPFYSNAGDDYVMDVSEAQWLNWGREQAQIGWWMADVEIDPFHSDIVSWGTGATLYSTRNLTDLGSGIPVTVAFDAKGIEETAVFKTVSAPVRNGSPELYSIMGDLTGFAHLKADERPDDAHFMRNGNAVDVAVAWQNGNIAAYTSENKKHSVVYTTDGGATWNTVKSRPDSKGGGTVALSADGAVLMWVPGSVGAKVYFTKDFGENWYIANGLGLGAKVYGDKCEANVFYAVCGGDVYVSKDGGTNFQKTGLMLADNCEIVPSAEKAGAVWIRSGGSVGFSSDYAKTVKYCEDMNAQAIGVGKAAKDGGPMTLYVLGTSGGQNGVFFSTDRGKHFVKLNNEQQQFGNITPAITGDATTYGRFYFATNGRGIIMGQVQS